MTYYVSIVFITEMGTNTGNITSFAALNSHETYVQMFSKETKSHESSALYLIYPSKMELKNERKMSQIF